jgi:acyl-CoA reductase-like NAD-dependent aldehyde dehydrogenase
MTEHFRLVIDGAAVDATDGKTFDTTNPHTGQVYGTVAEAGAEDVRRAREFFTEPKTVTLALT